MELHKTTKEMRSSCVHPGSIYIYPFGLYGHNDVSSGTSGASGPSGSSGSSGQAGPSGIGFPDASRLQDLGTRLTVLVCLVTLLFTNSRNVANSQNVVLYYYWILIFFHYFRNL